MKKLLLLSIFFSFQFTNSQVPAIEREALIALYNSTDGPNWNSTSNTNWNTNVPVSGWAGIDTEIIANQEHVIKIELASSYLNGTLPSEIGNLTELKNLQIIFNNNLTGDIPIEIGNLLKLEVLSFWNNNLTGTIPSEIGNCSNLIDLLLDDNQLTGNIPQTFENFDKLRTFWVNGNQLSGTIPDIFSNWSELVNFSIGEEKTGGLFNNFDGHIDLSNSPKLNLCWIYKNNISTLNVKNGNNASITNNKFNTKENPNLSCVIVDDTAYSTSTWLKVDSNSIFKVNTGECSTLSLNDLALKNNAGTYPNPTSGIIKIFNNTGMMIEHITIKNSLGQTLRKSEFKKIIDISDLTSGVYYIGFNYNNGNRFNYKVIKK